MAEPYRRVARAISAADTVVALTGAGVSTASGIPSFRGDDGIWERYDPDAFTIWRFERDPDGFWSDWLGLHDTIFEGATIEPNPAHEALAILESKGVLDAVITQNVDGLHRAAGSERVIELHGNADRVVCRECGRGSETTTILERVREDETAPVCEECGGSLKPDTVLFGESLPQDAYLEASALAQESDCFLAIGSSLTVEPAASLPEQAHRHGATLIVANTDPTPVSDRADVTFRESVSEVLPDIVAAIEAVG